MFLQYFLLPSYFNFQPKIWIKKGKKINDLSIVLITLTSTHLILNFCIYKTIQGLKLKSILLEKIYPKSKFKFIRNIIIFIFSFLITSLILFKYLGSQGIQICNFIFSFIIIFEASLKVADCEVFKDWLSGLDRSLRLMVMFVLGLNLEYFFTRLTHQIILSQNL